MLKTETCNNDWYCTNCKADCGLCSGAVLGVHKAFQCDGCEMWIHNECSFITEAEYENVLKSGCTWICPKCEFFNFSDSFFDDQLNLMNRNRFDPLTKGKNDGISSNRTNQTNSLGGLKFISLNINSNSGLFPEACPYNIFRKDRNLHGGGVMLLIHKDIPHIPLS